MRMRTFLSSLFIGTTVFSLGTIPVLAQDNPDVDFRETAVGSTILDQMRSAADLDQLGPHFRAGETVALDETYTGDVYAAGGTVQSNGTINGDLLAAGGTVTISGTVTDDLRVAGGTIIIDGTIGKNVTVTGGTVTFTQDSTVGGSVVVAGGSVVMDGKIAGNVYGGSGTASLRGAFGSNVVMDVGTLTIPEQASISGSLRATVEENPSVSQQARINGAREVKVREQEQRQGNDTQGLKGLLGAGLITQFILGSLIGISAGAILLYLFPEFWEKTAREIEASPLSTLGWGLTYVLLVPVVFILLLVTVVGMPLAFILLFIWIISMIVAGWVTAYAVGRLVFRQSEAEWLDNKYLQLIVGVLGLNFIGIIPLLGWIVKALVFFVGMGAVFSWIKSWIAPNALDENHPAEAVVRSRPRLSAKRRGK